MYYCIRKPRDINNMGDVPCPDVERCELCGNHNPDMQCLSVTLTRGELKLIAKVMSAQTDPGLQALAEKISKAAGKD